MLTGSVGATQLTVDATLPGFALKPQCPTLYTNLTREQTLKLAELFITLREAYPSNTREWWHIYTHT